jgi:hypothetical protein
MKVEGIPSNVNVNHNHNVAISIVVDDQTAEYVKDIAKIIGVSICVAAAIKAFSNR